MDKLVAIDRRERASAQYSHEVRSHEIRVGRLASKFGKYLRLDKEICRQLFWAGRFHDIGKLKLPHNILFKKDPLDKQERHIVNQHTEMGLDVLGPDNTDVPKFLLNGIAYHHEKYDGFGVNGLSGKEIPLIARIISIADSFDALTAKRSYKAEIDAVKALSIMVASSEIGQQCSYDPILLRTFTHHQIKNMENNTPILHVLKSYMTSNPQDVIERLSLKSQVGYLNLVFR